MKKSLLLAFIFIGFMSEAQIKRYSFKVAANYPLIKDVKNSHDIATGIPTSAGFGSYTLKATLKQTFESHVGFDASGNIDYSFSDRFFITTGLSASYVRFKQKFLIDDWGSTTEVPIRFPATATGSPIGGVFGDITFRDADGN